MKKSTLIAVGIFGALLVAFVATREGEVKVGVQKLELAKVSPDELVSMSFGAQLVRFQNGAWTVGGEEKRYLADENQVKAASQALSELKSCGL